MCVERSNERPEGVRVSKACGCRGLVGIEGVVEGVGIAALRVHGHERTHSCVLRSGVRCYIINSQMGGTHLDHTSLVNIPGNPRVFISYPYPYPLKPPPALRGKGYRLDG